MKVRCGIVESNYLKVVGGMLMDFEEIAHSGGKLNFGNSGYGIHHSNFNACRFYILCVSFNGIPLMSADIKGLGVSINMPQPSVPVIMISDKEGFFGMRCSSCKEYFRTTSRNDLMYCPYCGEWHYGIDFLTENQKQYVNSYIKVFLKSLEEGRDVELDLDSIMGNLSDNRSPFVYTEQRQQKRIKCSCGIIYDILGEYGGCPICNKRNSLEVLLERLAVLEDRVINPIFGKDEREKREKEWIETLKNCVSDFEALGNDLKQLLLILPATPRRKNDIRDLNFQNVTYANDKLKNWYGIDFLLGISEEDKNFIIRSFGRRHLFTHNAGVVDQEYLDKTGDTTVRLRERLHIRSREVKRLIELVGKMGQQLFEEFDSLS